MTKIGLDGHDRGLKILAKKLNDTGFEVIYLGLFQTVEDVIHAAIQEDVDFIGVSVLDGGQLLIAEDLMEALRAAGATNIKVIFGGIIPDSDMQVLRGMGVEAVFGPGTPIVDIIQAIDRILD